MRENQKRTTAGRNKKKTEVNEMLKLNLVKLEKRVAPRYVPF
jgi:hypothetical protein